MLIRQLVLAATLAAVFAPAVHAARLSVPDISVGARETSSYQCRNGKQLRVSYLNETGVRNPQHAQSFAVVRVNGKSILMVATVAASGVRYEGGGYIWWTKGRGGNLFDAVAGDSAPALLADCTQARR